MLVGLQGPAIKRQRTGKENQRADEEMEVAVKKEEAVKNEEVVTYVRPNKKKSFAFGNPTVPIFRGRP